MGRLANRPARPQGLREPAAHERGTVATRYNDMVTTSDNKPASTAPVPVRRTAILAIDYGTVRIGLALADIETAFPRPLATLERINRNEDMRRLREFVREHGVREIVVGLPLRLDGSRGDMAEEATRFGDRVRKQLGVPVEMVDELIDQLGSRATARRTGRQNLSRRRQDFCARNAANRRRHRSTPWPRQ